MQTMMRLHKSVETISGLANNENNRLKITFGLAGQFFSKSADRVFYNNSRIGF